MTLSFYIIYFLSLLYYMKIIKKIISLIVLIAFFASNSNIINAIENNNNTKKLIIAKYELKSLKNWKKYVSQIDKLVEKYKNDKEKLTKLKSKIAVAKYKINKKNDLKSKKVLVIINYLEIKIALALLEMESDLDNIVEEKIKELETASISSEEQKNVQDKMVKLQLNLLEKWTASIQNLIDDFEKLSNYEEKGNFKMNLNIDQEQIGKIKASLNLEDYITKNSNFDSQITWKINTLIDTNLKWEEELKLEMSSLLDFISKDGNMYMILEELKITDEKINGEIKSFLETIKEIAKQNKYIKFKDENYIQAISLLRSLTPENILSDWKVILSEPMFKAYKKDWEKYLLVPTRHACNTMKDLANTFDPFNPKNCSDSQYKKLLEDLANSKWEFYIEVWENTKLWYDLKNSNQIENLEWYIIFSDTNIEEVFGKIEPNKEKYLWEWAELDYERNSHLNIKYYADKWKIDVKMKSKLDEKNNFSFIDYSWKLEDFNSDLKLENKIITGKFEHKTKSYDWKSEKYIYSSKLEWKINGNTYTNNEIKNINLDITGTDLKNKEKYFTGNYKYKSGKFSIENYYLYEWNKLDFVISWNWNSNEKIIDELNLLISSKKKKRTYNYETYKYNNSWDFEEVVSSNIKLEDKVITWNTKLYEDWVEIIKINHLGRLEKDYFELDNKFNITNFYKKHYWKSAQRSIRDTNRTSKIISIHDWLELYRTIRDLPLPDNYKEIKKNWEIIAYQWYAWESVLKTIGSYSLLKDPLNNKYFQYYLNVNRNDFILLGCLENKENNFIEDDAVFKFWKTWKEYWDIYIKCDFQKQEEKAKEVKWNLKIEADIRSNKNNVNIYFDLDIDDKKIIEFEIDNKWTIEYKDDIKIETPKDYIDSEDVIDNNWVFYY